MAEFPGFARLTLSQLKTDGNHPDASLLTGFVERTLTSPLRTQVMEHLAGCAQCRGLVFLATPKDAPVLEPQKVFTWHMPRFRYGLRWAAAVASVFVVGGSIWLTNPIVSHKSAPTNNQTVAVATQPAVSSPATQPESTSPSVTPAQPRTVRHSAPRVQKPAAIEVATARPATEIDRRAMYQTSLNSVPVERALPKVVLPSKPAMLFMISGPGILYKSFDSGKSWQSVDNVETGLKTVASIGSTVWVGTSTGSVFRSNDNGQNWTQVNPWGKAGNTEAIEQIQFTDALNGSVKTAHAKWDTSDGGLTWHKQ